MSDSELTEMRRYLFGLNDRRANMIAAHIAATAEARRNELIAIDWARTCEAAAAKTIAERDRLREENATLRKIIRDAHYALIDDELAKGLE